MRTLFRVLFLVVTLTALGLGHLYVWRRLARDAALSALGRKLAAGALVVGMLLIPAALFLSRAFRDGAAQPLPFLGFLWVGTLFYLVLYLGLLDLGAWIVRRIAALRARRRGPDEGAGSEEAARRRVTVARVLGATALLGAALTSLWGVAAALGPPDVREVEVQLEGLAPEQDGFTIALLTDMHVGPLLGKRFVERTVRQVNGLRPDLVAITGDLVDRRVETVAPKLAGLAGLRAPHGVWFVLGNHEYYASSAQEWLDHLPQLGVRPLANEHVTVGPADSGFQLAGVHDWRARGRGKRPAPDLAGALRGHDPQRPVVLLAHAPAQIEEAAARGVDLQLSGHTHGGQLWPFAAIVALTQPHLAGLHRHATGTWLYISRGLGFWGPPLRVLAPPEIALVRLRSASARPADGR